MTLCSSSKHEEVCYEGNACPACDAYQTGYDDGYDVGNSDGYKEGLTTGQNSNE